MEDNESDPIQQANEGNVTVAGWHSLLDPEVKIAENGLGSGNLHRKGRNFKPVNEDSILQNRLHGKALDKSVKNSGSSSIPMSKSITGTECRFRPVRKESTYQSKLTNIDDQTRRQRITNCKTRSTDTSLLEPRGGGRAASTVVKQSTKKSAMDETLQWTTWSEEEVQTKELTPENQHQNQHVQQMKSSFTSSGNNDHLLPLLIEQKPERTFESHHLTAWSQPPSCSEQSESPVVWSTSSPTTPNASSLYSIDQQNNSPNSNVLHTSTPPSSFSSSSRFSIPNRPKFSRPKRDSMPKPSNYQDQTPATPRAIAPPPAADNPIIITINVVLPGSLKEPVDVRLHDDPETLAKSFGNVHHIKSPKIIHALFELFDAQKNLAMKTYRPVSYARSYRHQ